MALYYNKDILGTAGIATPPKTWDDLAVDARKITKQDQTGYFSRSGVAIGTNTNVNKAFRHCLFINAASRGNSMVSGWPQSNIL